jgi:hypothetical protein
MKIIADTNVWIRFAEDEELFEKVKSFNLCPTFVNVYEQVVSHKLVSNVFLSRRAIQKMFYFKVNVIDMHPLIYLASLNAKHFKYNYLARSNHYFEAAKLIANSGFINDKNGFIAGANKKKASLQQAADYFNNEAILIRERLSKVEKSKKWKENTSEIIAGFLNSMVMQATNSEYDIDGLDLKRIELLILTLGYVFKSMEIEGRKLEANDWYDILQLAYVQPGDKIWSFDRKMVNVVKDANCENYLFDYYSTYV